MAEPRRRRKRTSASQVAALLPPYITRTAPVYEILDEEQITAIEEAPRIFWNLNSPLVNAFMDARRAVLPDNFA